MIIPWNGCIQMQTEMMTCLTFLGLLFVYLLESIDKIDKLTGKAGPQGRGWWHCVFNITFHKQGRDLKTHSVERHFSGEKSNKWNQSGITFPSRGECSAESNLTLIEPQQRSPFNFEFKFLIEPQQRSPGKCILMSLPLSLPAEM